MQTSDPRANYLQWKIVDTDNFGSDYPNEKWVDLPGTSQDNAIKVCNLLRSIYCHETSPRWYKVEHRDYVLQPGFEP